VGNFYIFAGEKGSGKTTALHNWIKFGKYKCDGILTLTKDRERYFYSIKEQNTVKMTVDCNSNEPYYSIGHYCFSKSAFEFANNTIMYANKMENKFLIIDEAGFLELENKGYHNSLSTITNKQNLKAESLIIVVRNFLVDRIIDKYFLDKSEVQFLSNINQL